MPNAPTLSDDNAFADAVHQILCNGSNLAGGAYFSRVEFDGMMPVKKMLLLK